MPAKRPDGAGLNFLPANISFDRGLIFLYKFHNAYKINGEDEKQKAGTISLRKKVKHQV